MTTIKSTKATETKNTESPAAEAVETVVVEVVETAAISAKEAVDLTVKATNEATAKGYEQAVAVASGQIDAASKASNDVFKSYKGYEDVVAFHKGNFDAIIEASNIWVNGIQDLNKAWGALASKSVEQSAASTKKLINCKTVEDVLALNSEAVKSSYDAAVVETKNLNEMSVKLAETSVKPLATRVNETVAQFSKPLAA